jgi:hypothetical protein
MLTLFDLGVMGMAGLERLRVGRSHFGSPHDALELPAQPASLSRLFICQQG